MHIKIGTLMLESNQLTALARNISFVTELLITIFIPSNSQLTFHWYLTN